MTHQRTTRSRLTALIGTALAAGVLLTACSAASPEQETAASSALPQAEGKTEYPLTLSTAYGETVLEERPTRIAAVVPNAVDTDVLLALDVEPVLTSSLVTEGGYLAAHGGDDIPTYEFVMGEEIPVEAVAAAKPDLIVAVGWSDGIGGAKLGDSYAKLSKIAPVVASEQSDGKTLIPWQDSIRTLGEALDLQDAAQRVVDEHEAAFEKLREEHPGFEGLTASWVIDYGAANGLQYLSQPGSAAERFLTELGFAKNPAAAEFAGESRVSDELIGKIDADVLVIGRSAASSEEGFAELTGSELFTQLGAVSSGRWVALEPKTEDGGDLLWGITSGGPIGQLWAAEQLAPLVDAAL